MKGDFFLRLPSVIESVTLEVGDSDVVNVGVGYRKERLLRDC